MDPAFTLSYSEYEFAIQLQKHFPKSEGFSVFIPLSRQEKAIDLVLVRKRPSGKTKALTFQVKASRTWTPVARKNPRTEKLAYRTWHKAFTVHDEADYYVLCGVYFGSRNLDKPRVSRDIRNIRLLFTNEEMKQFLQSLRTVSGNTETMFSFGFDDPTKVVLKRGIPDQKDKDFTKYLFERRISSLRRKLGG